MAPADPPHVLRERLTNLPSRARILGPATVEVIRAAATRERKEKTTSQYRGVHRARSGRWVAQIQHEWKSFQLGTYDAEVAAAHPYDDAARRLKGENARVNFRSGHIAGGPREFIRRRPAPREVGNAHSQVEPIARVSKEDSTQPGRVGGRRGGVGRGHARTRRDRRVQRRVRANGHQGDRSLTSTCSRCASRCTEAGSFPSLSNGFSKTSATSDDGRASRGESPFLSVHPHPAACTSGAKRKTAIGIGGMSFSTATVGLPVDPRSRS
jgi:hypothetical protein